MLMGFFLTVSGGVHTTGRQQFVFVACAERPYPVGVSTHAAPAEVAERLTTAAPRSFVALALAGVVSASLAGALVWTSPLVEHAHATAAGKAVLVAAYVGVGLYTWWQRPSSRLGPLLAGAGFLYTATSLAAVDDDLLFTIGRLSLAVLIVYFVYLFASVPRGRLNGPFEHRFVAGAAAVSALLWAVLLLAADRLPHGGPLTDCQEACPGNGLQVIQTRHEFSTALGLATNVVTALIAVGIVGLLARKAASEPLVRERTFAPLMYAAIALAATFATYSVIAEAASPPGTGLRIAGMIAAISVPLAFLYAQVRGRLVATRALWREMAHIAPETVTPAWLQQFLRSALGDPSVELGVWREERDGYTGVDGRPFELPTPSATRSVTHVTRMGIPSLVLVHDVALDENLEVVLGLGRTAATLLENRTLVQELRTSRARIVESVEEERHRLERNLHDGAQQRLTTIQLKLAVASEEAEQTALRAELEELAAEAAAAASELRAVAHGIYPPLLHDAGVAPAIRAVAGRGVVPVRMIDRGIGRASPGIELAIYYCTLEALQNVARHAGPEARAVVTLARTSQELVFEVRDDGVGFDPAEQDGDGIGLVGMRDRIGAVGGRLEIRAAPGAGTSVRGSVPLAESSAP
jgi:signal transduction histidine kinase